MNLNRSEEAFVVTEADLLATSMGIVGLPNVGKSTIFNALTNSTAPVANYPFTTIDPNVGIVEVPDGRLEAVAGITKPEQITHATVEFIDIAGLVKGASRGEGLGNQFLAKIREVDAICHILRGFEESDIVHVSGKLSPIEDVEVITTEFRLADLDVIQRRIEKSRKKTKGGSKEEKRELELLEAVELSVSDEEDPRELDLGRVGRQLLDELFLLSLKPVLFVLNVDEEFAGNPHGAPLYDSVKCFADGMNSRTVAISGKIEAELCGLPPDERESFYGDLGIKESALEQLVRESRELLGLITFYTIKGNETRAWHIAEGTRAGRAAGKIHSDMERGFIKTEVISAEDFLKTGSMVKARETGAALVEGKDYIVRDGDILLFKFKT